MLLEHMLRLCALLKIMILISAYFLLSYRFMMQSPNSTKAATLNNAELWGRGRRWACCGGRSRRWMCKLLKRSASLRWPILRFAFTLLLLDHLTGYTAAWPFVST